MAYLVLVRHGISEWNVKGLWTGWNDVDLNEEGRAEARRAGEAIKDIKFSKVYVSDLKRSQQTFDEIQGIVQLKEFERIIAPELKERNYGDLAGKNKWKVKEEYGEEQFMKWRRSWDFPIPNGESLKDVYERVIPYYQETILKDLENGKNVLIAAHSNSLRALVKYLEGISNDEISKLEIGTGEAYVYSINEHGNVIHKEIRSSNPKKGKV